jgi:hypothetical protein
MTTYLGNSGVVKVGASPAAVAETTDFEITEQTGTAEDTVQGDTARTYLADGLPSWSGTINCRHYPGDTNGQAALLVGTAIAFEGYAIGTATGREKLSGTAIVTQRQITSANGAVVGLALQVQGSGALTHGAAA